MIPARVELSARTEAWKAMPLNYAKLFDLSGKRALITGGGGGIGSALAAGLASHGADVACIDLTEEIARRGTKSVQDAGRRGLAFACDIREPAEIERTVARVLDEFGSLEILVNLAGKGILKPVLDYTGEDWEHMVNTYLRGTFLFSQIVGREMCRRGRGSIINISSVASIVALGRGTGVYAAVKAGVNALTRELAVEWAGKGVRVNAIAPCQIDTPQLRSVLADPQFDATKLMQTWLDAIPLGRLGRPEELIGPCVFLASEASSLVTGHVLMADGGYTIK
jgi:NAD(P)-dependent dehydrogenase (short-subunit alcohol dehydrogenase family)